MNAVPISPPNSRLICSRQPIASASAGLIERMISVSSAVSANDWPIAWRICEGQEIDGRPLAGQVGRHPAGDADQRAAEGQHPTAVDPFQQVCQRQGNDELRQGDPEQHAADLQLAEILHGLQVGRDDVGGREDDEAEARQHQHQQQQIAPQQPAQVEERPRYNQFAGDEGQCDKAAGQQQADDQPAACSSPAGCPGRGRRRAAPKPIIA